MKRLLSRISNLLPEQIIKIWACVYLLVYSPIIWKFAVRDRVKEGILISALRFTTLILISPLFIIVTGPFGNIINIARYRGDGTCRLNIDPRNQAWQVLIILLCILFYRPLAKNWRKASGCFAIIITASVFVYLTSYLIVSLCFTLPNP